MRWTFLRSPRSEAARSAESVVAKEREMMRLKRMTVRTVLIAGLLVVGAGLSPNERATADWRDTLKELKEKSKETGRKVGEKVKDAKQEWKERERRCSECGKIIHFGSVCTSCQAKAAAEKARRAKETFKREYAPKMREGWEKTKSVGD